ncbi:amidase [Tothia fuscella]|uniref:amidase n=1 Tax=Tothia fuscella TaxID=1048955 RepID=A0A9P4U2P9_9PEZI|nr:amidase [Tothia fuscella]
MPPKKKAKTKPKRSSSWEDTAKEAQDHRDATIALVQPQVSGFIPSNLPKNTLKIPSQILTDEEMRITGLAPEDIVEAITSGDVTATQVTNAFLRRAAIAPENELLPQSALATATLLNNLKPPKGPLHGLPISVKEHIGIAGLRLHAGYISLYDNIAKEDALVLKILRRGGAIFHARTTEPQGMMQLETHSNLYGVTTNAFNSGFSAGGSSGGEGALIACGGSCLGVGSDVGGSIRVPAAAKNIFGFKPSAFRIPTMGWSSTPRGLVGISLFMKTVIDAEPWHLEPALIPMAWRPATIAPSSSNPLKLGILWHDEVVLPHPPITRALASFIESIKHIPNVQVVDFEPYKHDEAWAITSSLYFTDGGTFDRMMIDKSGEPYTPLAKWILKDNNITEDLTREELEYWLEEREEYRLEYADHWNKSGGAIWDDEMGKWAGGCDVVISPVGPGAGTKHGTARYWSYTSLWNLLDYPALAFPNGCFVDKDVDLVERRKKYFGGVDEEVAELYNPEDFHGLPVGLQMIGRRFEDEKVIAITKFLLNNRREDETKMDTS